MLITVHSWKSEKLGNRKTQKEHTGFVNNSLSEQTLHLCKVFKIDSELRDRGRGRKAYEKYWNEKVISHLPILFPKLWTSNTVV
jgi:hypothetical protein